MVGGTNNLKRQKKTSRVEKYGSCIKEREEINANRKKHKK